MAAAESWPLVGSWPCSRAVAKDKEVTPELGLCAFALNLEHRIGIKKAHFISTTFYSICRNFNKILAGKANFDSIYDHNNDYFKTTANVNVPMRKYHTAKKRYEFEHSGINLFTFHHKSCNLIGCNTRNL